MRYGVDDKPGPVPLLLYGLQWLVISLPFAVIIGGIAARAHYPGNVDLQTLYLQKMMIIMGLTAVAQVIWGHRLPLVVGPAEVVLIGVLTSLSSGIPAIYTAVIVGGAVFTLAALTGALGKIQKIFTTRIIVTILFLIALTLTPAIIELVYNTAGQPQFNLLFTVLVTLGLIIGNRILPGIWKSLTVLLGIVAGSLLYYAAAGLPAMPEAQTAFGLAPGNILLPGLEFDLGTVLALLICYVALFVNEIGSIEAAAQMLGARDMEKRTGRAVGIFGASNVLSGLGGVVGSVDYTLSLGVISATGCASRYTLIPAGLGLALFALFPPAIAILACIPGVIMAAVLIHLLTAIIASAFNMLVNEKAISSFNSGLVIGLPLMLAVLVAFTPESALASCPPLLRPIIGNAFVLSTLAAVLLEHVVLRENKG